MFILFKSFYSITSCLEYAENRCFNSEDTTRLCTHQAYAILTDKKTQTWVTLNQNDLSNNKWDSSLSLPL